jgi:hypothetical protein
MGGPGQERQWLLHEAPASTMVASTNQDRPTWLSSPSLLHHSHMTHTYFGVINRIDAGGPGTVHPLVEALLRAMAGAVRPWSPNRAVSMACSLTFRLNHC